MRGTQFISQVFIIGIISLFSSVQSGEICDIQLTACPEDYIGTTITVPTNIVALSSKIRACGQTLTSSTTTTAGAPSIMFVIDNSGSMSGVGQAVGNDETGSRFTVTKALLDSISKVYPSAQVGLVVFREYLYFDKTSTQYFAQYFQTLPTTYDGNADQAYLKLLTLNQNYNGKLGIDIIRDALATNTVDTTLNIGGTVYTKKITDLVYRPNFTISAYTNINIGMIAAKDAMAAAVNSKDRQFVIFLSDGEPAGQVQAGMSASAFTAGTNMPTTFTVFFTPNNTAPASLTTMTNNIKANNYSATNPKSDLWTIQTSYSSLMTLLMENVMKTILVEGNPSRMIMNGISSVSFADSSFKFTDRFALKADTTHFNGTISYHYVDPKTNQGRDTTITLAFVIRRQAGASIPPNVITNCWTQPDIKVYNGTTSISQVSPDMTQLQVHLVPNDEVITAAKVVLGSSVETGENITLTKSGAEWIGSFSQSTTGSAVAGDKIVFHQANDSLIAVWRNPKLPLDTVRISIAFVPNPDVVPATATLRDTSGDGHIDRIDLSWTPDTLKLLNPLPDPAKLVQTMTVTLANGSTVTLKPVAVVPGTGPNISIIVQENSGPKETGWNSADVKLTSTPVSVQGNSLNVVKVIDGSGPVISRGQYYSSPFTGASDTIKVTFSEPIDCNKLMNATPSQVFVFFVDGQKNSTVLDGAKFVGTCATQFTTTISMIVKNKTLETPEDDSIALIGGVTAVVDQTGNNPPLNNKGVMLEWSVKNLITLGTSENPFIPGKTEIDMKVQQFYAEILHNQTSGIVIGITSIKPLKSEAKNGYYGTVDIYDAVGNIVVENLAVEKTSSGAYGLVWNGKNRNGRTVGAGAYLAIVTVKDVTNAVTKQRIKIGVKR